MGKNDFKQLSSRRTFLSMAGLGLTSLALSPNLTFTTGSDHSTPRPVTEPDPDRDPSEGWEPVSDRKIRVGIVGHGRSRFGAAFGFQDHPNVEIVAVSDLFPDRRAALAQATRCDTTYPSLAELLKDDRIEAVFLATDAPSHAQHAIETLRNGKHVGVAVPAVFGSLEDADRLFEEVRKSGLKYMMFETSSFRANLYAMRQIYQAGGFGKLIFTEGEYYSGGIYGPGSRRGTSHLNWRIGMPPMWYPTHNDAYYVGVTDKTFVEVSCLGWLGDDPERNPPDNNKYNNPFRMQIALYRTSEGGMARMARGGSPGHGAETGRCRGEKGSYYERYQGLEENLPDLNRPPIPPGVLPGGHGGSHGRLMNEFVLSLLEDRKPMIDIVNSLNMTVGGIVAHQSALKDGEWMKIPQYS